MSKLKSVAVAGAFVALAALVVWQEVRARRLMLEAAALRKLNDQAAAVREENERLAAQLQSATERARADSAELARLRGQSVRLRQVEQENAQLKSERDRLARASRPVAEAPESDEPLTPEAKLRRAKGTFGRDLGLALIFIAQANDGNLPAELRGPVFDVLEQFSPGGQEHNFRAKDFELVYRGSLRDLKDGERVIMAREREPAQRADGQWERVYVMTDGSSQRISAATRDGFAAREREFWPGQFGQ